jgi:RNA polymerase sigma factor (sigma-70 family)
VAAAQRWVRADADLVRAARAGDKGAFAALIGRHRPMVLALVRSFLGRRELAEDAVQEASVVALVGLDRLRCPERFGAWYAGIALNVSRRWLREIPAGLVPSVDRPDPGPGPAEQAEAAELARRVHRAVGALAPGQRAAVLAFYWQGLTHVEAAAELGIRPNAVKARLHQARAALAPQLAPYLQPEQEVRSMASTTETAWIDMDVVEVRRSGGDDPTRRTHAVVLAERGGSRRLPIYIGPAEAAALACNLESLEMPRPMTHQLAASLVEAGGSRLAEVRVTRLAESTFYAIVVVDGPVGRAEVDARPSDALNLALVCGVPIRVDTAVLDNPEATRHDRWQQFPTGAPDLAAEVRERQAEPFRP